MQRMVKKIFESYGTALALRQDGKDEVFRGFLQPGKSISQSRAMQKVSPLGETSGDTYLFIGPVNLNVRVGDLLMQGEKYYELRQVETVMYRDEPIYIWGLCVEKGGVDNWGR